MQALLGPSQRATADMSTPNLLPNVDPYTAGAQTTTVAVSGEARSVKLPSHVARPRAPSRP